MSTPEPIDPPAQAERPVLIAGGGPVGMTTALLLARLEVPSIVLEAAPTRKAVGSKAICFQRDVLDILQRVGVAGRAVGEGVTWSVARTFFRDKELFSVELPDSGARQLPPFINLSQSALEGYLWDAVDEEPLVDYRLGSRVVTIETGADPTDGHVAVRVKSDTEKWHTLEGSFLVGADGARSTVREQIGAQFPGHSFDEQFLIADIEANLPFPAERHFYFDPEWNPGRQVLVHQQPKGIWRIDWQVPADFDLERARESGELDARIRMIVGGEPYRIDWVSVYRFHQRMASRFRAGRVFLAGDAAHLMSPFGARGLNSGLQDAENLAWKLAWTLQDRGGPELLDSYGDERMAAAKENLRVTGDTMRFLVPQTEEDRRHRHDVLHAASRDPLAREQVNSGVLAEPFWYLDSPLTTPLDRKRPFPKQAGVPRPIVPGVLCPDMACQVPGFPHVTRLRELFGREIVVLAFGETAAIAAEVESADPADPPVLTIRGDQIEGLAEHLTVAGDVGVVVRPDGHIAAIAHPDDIADAIRTAVGHGLPHG